MTNKKLRGCDQCGTLTRNEPQVVAQKSGPHVADSGDVYEILCDSCQNERAESIRADEENEQ